MIAFLELVTLNYAAIFGLLEDAVGQTRIPEGDYELIITQHLTVNDFAWLGSIYYFGAVKGVWAESRC